MFTKEPVRGMHDVLPKEMEIRESLLRTLQDLYGRFGFMRIETPCLERIENLSNKQGGENEKLVFQILKRGDKLKRGLESHSVSVEDIVDCGLRYDLTVPLARYYANNSELLPTPFKALQIGPVWRADRPQKGRYRQFTQCDIDILGDASVNVEIELIYVTSLFLERAGIQGCRILLNDRRVLRALVESCHFPEDAYADVLIILDKYDKIGLDGIRSELERGGYPSACIESYVELLSHFLEAPDRIGYCRFILGGDGLGGGAGGSSDGKGAGAGGLGGGNGGTNDARSQGKAALDDLERIIEGVSAISSGTHVPEFDLSLVRGMGYYTGAIFEITSTDFAGSSIAGGGRYDKMIGQYTGKDVDACGFSIGFERIVRALMEKESTADGAEATPCIAILYPQDADSADVALLQKECASARQSNMTISVLRANKNLHHQKKLLQEIGYTEFITFELP
ncbi:MAG: histidine--tRNA ligase, partial [Coriobacteriales bacterium]|nr:histidine--tRNA ligase [Coriobacteriales bacterium]